MSNEKNIKDAPELETEKTPEFDINGYEVVSEDEVNEVMKKYDRESNTRIWVGVPHRVVQAVMAPAPDAVFETARALGCPTDELCYVGDSDVDAMTAQNAGCRCVLVSWGFRERKLLESFSPSAVVDTAEELAKELIK